LQVLEYYGAVERVPDPRVIEEQRKAVLWDEALAALGNVLIRRNIVDPDGAALAEDAENDTDQEMQGDFMPCHF
jgi:hypothetical protein